MPERIAPTEASLLGKVVNRFLFGLFFALTLLPFARAVVDPPLSMQKLAAISDCVLLAEELELQDHVVEYPNGAVRTVIARCRPLRVFKGVLGLDDVVVVHYSHTRRVPRKMGYAARDESGRVTETKPRKLFPPGKVLLFLKTGSEAPVYAVIGARLLYQDEVYDLDQNRDGSSGGDIMAREIPENSVPAADARYGEAELVADLLTGMEQLADPTRTPQYLAPPGIGGVPPKIPATALALGLSPALLWLVLCRACRGRWPKNRTVRVSVLGLSAMLAAVLGIHGYAITTIRSQRPLTWNGVRPGMTVAEVRGFASVSDRRMIRYFDDEQYHLERKVAAPFIRGSWFLDFRYDASGRVERATIHYYGNFRRFISPQPL